MAEVTLLPRGRTKGDAGDGPRRRDNLVLVTGSSGFIGRALIRRLVDTYEVVGFDAIIPSVAAPEFETVRVDLSSDDSVRAAFGRVRAAYGSRIASVVHLAAYFDLSGEPNPLYESVTIRGTERLLTGLDGFDVEQLIFSSTMLVHAPTVPGRPIDENWPIDPHWVYPQSKAAAEAILRERHGDIPLLILRAAGVYDDRCHSAFLAQQIARIFEKQLISHVYPGDMTHGQANLHLDDFIDAVLRAIENRSELPKETALLLGEASAPSYRELQDRIARLIHGLDWETRELPKVLAKRGAWIEGDVLDEEPFIQPWMIDRADDHYELDTRRAESLLGWRPRHALIDTLPRIIESLKADPEGWYRANKLNAAKVASADIRPPNEAGPDAGEPAMGAPERAQERQLRKEHQRTLWAHFTTMALGLWLVTSPFAFGMFDGREADEAVRRITTERDLPPAAVRDTVLAWSDIVCGALVMLFSALSCSRR